MSKLADLIAEREASMSEEHVITANELAAKYKLPRDLVRDALAERGLLERRPSLKRKRRGSKVVDEAVLLVDWHAEMPIRNICLKYHISVGRVKAITAGIPRRPICQNCGILLASDPGDGVQCGRCLHPETFDMIEYMVGEGAWLR